MDIFNPISLDDPEFFQKINAARPDLFNQEQMAKNIEDEKSKRARREMMTNYNERLEEIIAQASAGIGGFGKLDNGKFYKGISEIEAKQAITSLIKELVAEAKPNKKPQFFCQACDKSEERGYNEAVKEFEQNLLKELEEV